MLRILPRLETRYNVVFAKWMETSRMSPAVPGDEEAKAPYFRHCDAVIGLKPHSYLRSSTPDYHEHHEYH